VQLLRFASALLIATSVLATPAISQQRGITRTATPYVPGATWEHRDPAAAGFDPARLTAAIQFAIQADAKAPRDMEESHYRSFGREPFGQASDHSSRAVSRRVSSSAAATSSRAGASQTAWT
jgi:hypothetical protein